MTHPTTVLSAAMLSSSNAQHDMPVAAAAWDTHKRQYASHVPSRLAPVLADASAVLARPLLTPASPLQGPACDEALAQGSSHDRTNVPCSVAEAVSQSAITCLTTVAGTNGGGGVAVDAVVRTSANMAGVTCIVRCRVPPLPLLPLPPLPLLPLPPLPLLLLPPLPLLLLPSGAFVRPLTSCAVSISHHRVDDGVDDGVSTNVRSNIGT